VLCFLQLSQEMAADCLLLFFPRSYLNLPDLCKRLFCSNVQKKFSQKQVNSGKNGEKHKSKQAIACQVLY
jgi:hypothetical protein